MSALSSAAGRGRVGRTLGQRARACWAALLIGSAILPSLAVAQGLPRLVGQRAAIGFKLDEAWSGQAAGATSRQSNLEEWFILPFAGSVLHPGILRYSFELRPTFRQAGSTQLPSSLNSRSIGFTSDATLLSATPLRVDLNLDRSSGRTSGGFGTRGEFEFTGMGAGISWTNWLLPMTARLDTRTGSSLTEVGPDRIPIARDDRSLRGRVSMRNRKLEAVAEWTEVDDRLRSNRLESRNLSLNHRFRWGKGSELLSRWRRTDRSGTISQMRSTWSEQIRIQHASSSRTTFTYSRSVSEGTGARASNRTLGWTFTARPITGVTLGGRASANKSDFAGGRQRNVNAGPQGSFRLAVPGNVRVSVGGFVGYVLRDIDGSTGGVVPVLNEEHEIGPTRAVRLDQSRVDPASIEVRSGDETILYEPGLDYEVVPLGGLTEIQIPPGSRILVGDKIVASYRFRIEIDTREEGVVTRFNLGLSRSGINVRHSRSERATEFSGTGAPVSGDFSQHSTSVSANVGLPFGRLRAGVTDRRRRSTAISYDFREGSASFLFPVWNGIQSSIDAGGSRAKDVDGATSRFSIGVSTQWAVRPELQLNGSFTAVRWRQQTGLSERNYV
ncbi:MAG: hypothetical protein ACE5FP_09855, partial [Gemmatimonadota bacterium]